FARFSTELSDEAVRKFSQNQAAEVDAALAAAPSKITEGCPLVSEILFAFPPAADEKDEAETRARAERVSAQAAKASGEDFAMLARIHSGAPSADYGGKRGCLNEADGEEVAQLIKAVEGLAPGATSKLVQQARGYYLLRLEDRPAADKLSEVARLWTARPLAVRAAADGLTREFAKALIGSLGPGKSMQDTLDSLTDNALATSPVVAVAKRSGGAARAGELSAAARESRHRPQVDVSPSFSRSGGATPVYNAVEGRTAKQIAFALPAVDAVYAEPIATRDGLAVMQLKDREPAKREDFDKEKSEYMRELKARAEVEALTAYLDRLRRAREAEITVNPRFLEDKAGIADDS
ncbi:MAG TPA: peptidylprolyl isomerase, partial [Polyangiaceae bacterium]|nr:peptidylprolyl isomerase [Polyangiaceae bacterium]